MGYEGDKNNPRYSLFSDSLLRHRVTIRVGINFKPKNPVEVLDFHKIQVRLNISRICTPKIRERVLGEITLCLIKGGGGWKICNSPLDLQIWIVRGGQEWDHHSIPDRLLQQLSCCSSLRIGYCNSYRYNLYHSGWALCRIGDKTFLHTQPCRRGWAWTCQGWAYRT